MNQYFFIIFILFFVSCSNTSAQESEIKITIKGAENKKLTFAFYYQDEISVVKEFSLDKKGKTTLEFDEKLPKGIYIIIIPEITYFDVLISDNQQFELKTNLDNPISNMKIKNSLDNKVFYDYQKAVSDLMESKMRLNEELANTSDTLKIRELEDEQTVLDEQITKYWKDEIERNEAPFFTTLLKAMHVFEVPYSEFYNYVDFSESSLVRTPFFHNILNYQIATNIEKSPQEIIKENDYLISLTKQDSTIYQYVTYYYLTKYKDICKFGINEVFVDISEKYFLNGNSDWLQPAGIELISKTVENYKYSMIGNKAYNFKALTTTGDSIALYDIDAEFKILFFWSVGCGHCEEAADSLRNNYTKLQNKGYDVFAINIDSKTTQRWEKYIKKQNYLWTNGIDISANYNTRANYYVCSSPLAYIIDKENIIIVKLYGQVQICDFVERYGKE